MRNGGSVAHPFFGVQGGAARALLTVLPLVLLASLLACHTASAGESTPLPGRPWTAIIPDPDTYDWSRNDRPGYRFRGMNEIQKRFHEYIQGKRAAKEELSWTERLLIRQMVAARRWPEGPRPNEFWAAYMRYLRSLPHRELNAAQNIMLTELTRRGLVPLDRDPSPAVTRLREFLETGPFAARNWFERCFGRVEDWMVPWLDNQLASHGHRLVAPGAKGSPATEPDGSTNGAWVLVRRQPEDKPNKDTERGKHRVASRAGGCEQAADTVHFRTLKRGHYAARFSWDEPPSKLVPGEELPYRLAVSVTVTGEPISSGIDAYMYWAWAKWTGDRKWRGGASGGSPNIQDSLCKAASEVSKSRTAANHRSGRWTVPGGAANDFLHVSATCSGPGGSGMHWSIYEYVAGRDAASLQADADWARHVNETLSRLGYSDTPVGRELKRMRDALAGTDADWRRYVAEELRRLGYDTSPDAVFHRELEASLQKGGEALSDFVARQEARSQRTQALKQAAQALLAKGDMQGAAKLVEELAQIDVRAAATLRGRLAVEDDPAPPFRLSDTTWSIVTHPGGHAAGYWTFLSEGRLQASKENGSATPEWEGTWRRTAAGYLCTMHYQGVDAMFLVVMTPDTDNRRFDVFQSDGTGRRGAKFRLGRIVP